MLVTVTTTVDSALAEWRRQSAWLGGGTALLLLLIAASVAAVTRQMRAQAATDAARAEEAEAAERAAQAARMAAEDRARLAEEQRRRARELAARDAGFRAAVEGMSQGLWKFSAEGRLTLTNQRCVEIVGFPRGALRPGSTLAELRAAVAEGSGAPAVLERLRAMVAAREAGSFVCDLEGTAPPRWASSRWPTAAGSPASRT